MSPEDETKQRIIQGAAQVFAQEGYEGATTRAIAQAAGVNEVTLFRHFGSKKNLFLAMISQQSPLQSVREALENQLTGDYRQDLLTVGNQYMTTVLKQRKEILMSLCAAEQLPEMREVIAQMPAELRQVLGDRLQQQMTSGSVREMNPQMAAQAFFGMLFAFAISQGVLEGTPAAQIPPKTVVEQFVDIFVQGTITSDAEER
ncbi:MAG: TetR/AcrR family transcriptional regulator [Anaerolineae bacterium]|nr:TetR/AcrR family transcriptional regulator [Anaerolineae bacterium]